ncbi:Zinc finger A20 and AN1 domain-containing stress-associated protein 2 [Raphanus sativus]|uniref:Zinc finger A20 and AN1 domain-containing stress-associated protein 2-like n=1 Tax=Raphanus sativus TaxID=3726 RepID=A0A6J0LJW1_RAPSA|nr:zinc finger A20 and AN1 domain-containing stress-associated protein 2-like [Raphanus sativus]KAJ4885480.1 Zinc finger A20 and AN1 domain-containing stress-associated protein 2 [Raphanus sativus]
MDHDKTACQSPPQGPKLCINNCGFFGSAATMNMCSKCNKTMLFQQEHGAKLASAVSGSPSNIIKETKSVEPMAVSVQAVAEVVAPEEAAAKPKEGPSRCTTCNKRVGLTGFKCCCGGLLCGTHRYADVHNCSFDYHASRQEAIAKANPVVKADKLAKI